LDFVSRWEGIGIREAGQVLTKNFVDDKATPPVGQAVEKPVAREAPPTKEAGPPAVRPASGGEAGESAENASSAQAPASVPLQNETPSRNEPLTFALKNVEPDHPSMKALGIQEDILTAFGVGYYSGRGMMENRIVIPIYNLSRQLVAYAGFHPKERTYTYPPKFRKELELYNLGGALAEVGADQGLILVRHPLEVITLVSVGYLNAVALMGDTVSKEQKDLLLCEYKSGERVTLLWPIHVDIVPPLDALYPDFFVRLRRYEEKNDIPSGFTAEEAHELLT
jgi:hypothetical protein